MTSLITIVPFFLSEFSCTNIHDLRDRRRRERLFIYLLSVTFSSLLLRKHSDINKTIRSVFVTTNTFGRISFGMLGFWSKFHLGSIFESRLIVWRKFWKSGNRERYFSNFCQQSGLFWVNQPKFGMLISSAQVFTFTSYLESKQLTIPPSIVSV